MPPSQASVIRLTGWEAGEMRESGLGLQLDAVRILTAAHIVASDRLAYRAGDVDYHVIWRDERRDVAVLARHGVTEAPEISFATVTP